jgi:long-chain acyl-CoA synthetase
MVGYYKAPEITAETLTEEGFLRTGDQGRIDDDGRLHITGRVKELFKTSKGKYVAPAPIENRLLANSLIEQVCVTGANLPQPIAVLNLNDVAQSEIASADSAKAIANELSAHLEAVNQTLDPHERLSCLVAVPERWMPENGFTTPTLKIKRNVIDETYSEHYEAWSAQGTKVIFK